MRLVRGILLCGLLLMQAATAPRERFTFTEKPQLSWSDFNGIPLKNMPYKASTNSGLSYSYDWTVTNGKKSMNITVGSYFYPTLSWKKDLAESSPVLLNHEQRHWEITELHARKLRKTYRNYTPGTNPKSEIQHIFDTVEKERHAMQMRYDKETQHGINKMAQTNWDNHIREQLFVFAMWQ